MVQPVLVSRKSTIKARPCGVCDMKIPPRVEHFALNVNGYVVKECPMCIPCYHLHHSKPHNVPHRLLLYPTLTTCANCRGSCGETKWIFDFNGTKICGNCFIRWARAIPREVHECEWEPNFDSIFCRGCNQVLKAGKLMYTCKEHKRGFCRECWVAASGNRMDRDIAKIGGDADHWYHVAHNLTNEDKRYKLLFFAAIEGHEQATIETIQNFARQRSTQRQREGLIHLAHKLASTGNNYGYLELGHLFRCRDAKMSLHYYKKAVSTNDPAAFRAIGNDYFRKNEFRKAYNYYVKGRCELEIRALPFYKFLKSVGLQDRIHNFHKINVFDEDEFRKIARDPAALHRIDFINNEEKKMLRERYSSKACLACNNGKTDCRGCSGSGTVRCPYGCVKGNCFEGNNCTTCEGTGRSICDTCNGSKKFTCKHCNGDSRVF